MATWIQSILDSTSKLESPRRYWYWSALATISAVVKRNVWFDRGGAFKVYPNIYVMLIGDSGIKKGLPMDMAQELVIGVNNTRMIDGRTSIQGLIALLSRAHSLEGGGMINTACGFLLAKEFDAFLVKDDATFSLLTNLFDSSSHKIWTGILKSGIETLKEPYLTLLGGSNERLLRKALPEETVEGGFLGRMFLINETEKGTPNPLIRKQEKVLDINKLLPYLKEMAKIEGPFEFEDDALIDYFEAWYNKHFYAKSDDRTGFNNRLDTHIIKVAMLLSLARSLDRIITKEDLDAAIEDCTVFTSNVKNVAEGMGTIGTDIKQLTRQLLEVLMKAPEYQMTKRKILRQGWIDYEMLGKVTENGVMAGLLHKHLKNGEELYELHEDVIKAYEAAKERVKQ